MSLQLQCSKNRLTHEPPVLIRSKFSTDCHAIPDGYLIYSQNSWCHQNNQDNSLTICLAYLDTVMRFRTDYVYDFFFFIELVSGNWKYGSKRTKFLSLKTQAIRLTILMLTRLSSIKSALKFLMLTVLASFTCSKRWQ